VVAGQRACQGQQGSGAVLLTPQLLAGCTMTIADEYPAAVYQHRGGEFVPTAYPPDSGTACSPTGGGTGCYMQTPESIRGKGMVAFL